MIYLPFILQGLVMFVDEFYFHRMRGLPLWERWGHPIDSLSVVGCYLYLIFNSYSETNLWIYVGLCSFSCVLVTKDEFVHTQVCKAMENWLHALLFILHPIAFLAAVFLWKDSVDLTFLKIQAALIFVFMIYQVVYWSFRGQRQ